MGMMIQSLPKVDCLHVKSQMAGQVGACFVTYLNVAGQGAQLDAMMIALLQIVELQVQILPQLSKRRRLVVLEVPQRPKTSMVLQMVTNGYTIQPKRTLCMVNL